MAKITEFESFMEIKKGSSQGKLLSKIILVKKYLNKETRFDHIQVDIWKKRFHNINKTPEEILKEIWEEGASQWSRRPSYFRALIEVYESQIKN